MASRRAKVTQSEIARSVKAVEAAGFHIGLIEIDHATGKVLVYPKGARPTAGAGPDPDELLQ